MLEYWWVGALLAALGYRRRDALLPWLQGLLARVCNWRPGDTAKPGGTATVVATDAHNDDFVTIVRHVRELQAYSVKHNLNWHVPLDNMLSDLAQTEAGLQGGLTEATP